MGRGGEVEREDEGGEGAREGGVDGEEGRGEGLVREEGERVVEAGLMSGEERNAVF